MMSTRWNTKRRIRPSGYLADDEGQASFSGYDDDEMSMEGDDMGENCSFAVAVFNNGVKQTDGNSKSKIKKLSEDASVSSIDKLGTSVNQESLLRFQQNQRHYYDTYLQYSNFMQSCNNQYIKSICNNLLGQNESNFPSMFNGCDSHREMDQEIAEVSSISDVLITPGSTIVPPKNLFSVQRVRFCTDDDDLDNFESIALEDALALSSSARIIIQASCPYTIVHMNAETICMLRRQSGNQDAAIPDEYVQQNLDQLLASSLTNHSISSCFSNPEAYRHFDNILQNFSRKSFIDKKLRLCHNILSEGNQNANHDFIVSRGDSDQEGLSCDFEIKYIQNDSYEKHTNPSFASNAFFLIEIIRSERSPITAPISVLSSKPTQEEIKYISVALSIG